MDNLRSHVKTVHQGKAGIKILEPEEGGEVSVVTVDDMVTLATEALAATAVTQLTGVDITQLPMQGTQVQSLVREVDPTDGNYEFTSCNLRSHMLQ